MDEYRYLKLHGVTYRTKRCSLDGAEFDIVQQFIAGGWYGPHWAGAGAWARQTVPTKLAELDSRRSSAPCTREDTPTERTT